MNTTQQQQNNIYPSGNILGEKPINWHKYFFLFLTNWYWFLIVIFFSISIAYMKNRYTLPKYQASATLLIEDEENTDDILSEIRSVKRRRNKTEMINEIAKLKAFSLHRRTIDSLGWDIFWTGHGRVAMERPLFNTPTYIIEIDSTSEIWYFDQTFFIDYYDEQSVKFYNKNGIDTIFYFDAWNDLKGWKFKITKSEKVAGYASYSFVISDPNTLAKQYLSKTVYEAVEEQGSVITIRSQGLIPLREIDYINMLCENYIYTGLERKRFTAENTLEFISDQIDIIQDSLRKTEKQLLSYRINKSVVDLSTEGQQAYHKLQNFFDQKTQLKLKQNYYEYLKEYILSKHDPQSIVAPILLDENDQMLINQVENLQRLYEERELLGFSAEISNPGLIRINSRIQTFRKKILEIIDGLIQNNELSLNQIDISEAQIEKQLLQLPVSEQELLNLQRKVEVNNKFYTFLLQKRAEAGIQRASTVSEVRILDQANIYNIKPVGTKKSLTYLFAFILGLIVPGGIIYIADTLDNRIKDRSDIEENTDIPILGVISHNISREDIPVHVRPGEAFAESFRHLRTNLQFILYNPDQKKIMISSSLSGEGKTFIAINFATILAMASKKVLLCGFDLRRPSLHKIFNLDNDNGISTFLVGKSTIEDIITPTKIEGLDIMTAGPTPPNPAELLGTNRLSELFTKVSSLYDYIVIDTPPVALVTDAVLISKYTDANVFVIRQNFSPKGVLEIINNLKDKQIKNLTLLVNDIKESKAFGYRYYYGYGYGYGYHYRYGDKYYTEESDNNRNI